jgi:hypothetical protein
MKRKRIVLGRGYLFLNRGPTFFVTAIPKHEFMGEWKDSKLGRGRLVFEQEVEK